MSFKYRVVEEGGGHYVLPRFGEMRTEVHAFLSRPLFDRTDERLWSGPPPRPPTPARSAST
jgi:hypothetical protein